MHCWYFCWFVISKSYKCSTPPPIPAQGYWGKSLVFPVSWSVFPALRNAWPTVVTELNHTSHQGIFRSQHRFLYICLTVDSVEKFLFISNLEKKNPYQTSTKNPSEMFENEWDSKLFWSSKWLWSVFFTHFHLWQGWGSQVSDVIFPWGS